MKINSFLKDKRHFLLFFTLCLILINSICFLDGNFRIEIHNLLYLNLLLLILLIIYLISGFVKRKIYFKDLNYYLEVQKEINPQALPKPQTEEHSLFNSLFENVYLQNLKQIHSLQNSQKEYSEFVDSWVHAIKTPITASYLILEHKCMDKSLKNEILSEINKVEYYVEQALYYSKSEDFSKDFIITSIYLDDLVKKIIKKEATLFIHKNLKPVINVPHIIIHSDLKWLFFILDQIVNNAAKYSDSNSTISFDYEKKDSFEFLNISNTGIGITNSDIPRIFEKGFTGNNGRKYGKSTGIGLYLAQKLSTKLGHSISVKSTPSKETCFSIKFSKNSNYYLCN